MTPSCHKRTVSSYTFYPFLLLCPLPGCHKQTIPSYLRSILPPRYVTFCRSQVIFSYLLPLLPLMSQYSEIFLLLHFFPLMSQSSDTFLASTFSPSYVTEIPPYLLLLFLFISHQSILSHFQPLFFPYVTSSDTFLPLPPGSPCVTLERYLFTFLTSTHFSSYDPRISHRTVPS